MNLISKAITILGVAAALSGLSPLVHAQPSQTQQTPPEPSVQNEPAPETNTQLSNKPDLNLLAKTVTNFLKSDRYQTESELLLTGTATGATFTSSVQIKTITQFPKQFRSEIAFTESGGSEAKRYLVVSNGNQVWTYHPDLKQYAVTDYETFDKSRDTFLIGLSSSLFLEMPADFREILAEGALSDQTVIDVLDQMLQSKDVPLKGGMRNLEGRAYYVYEYTDSKQGYTFSVLVKPETATIEQIQIAGKSAGLDLLVREQILRRIENPVIAADTFSFSPTEGITKVESLPIKPY